MATRQYIGARYVPLYMGDWDSTKNYEPLSIVTDANGNSFTSLKDVPASTPLTDRNYWIQTSSFSGAIDQLQRRMSAAEYDIAVNETNIGNLSALKTSNKNDLVNAANEIYDMAKKKPKKYVFLSDSYGDRNNSWIDKTVANLSISSDNYFKKSIAGGGFSFGTTFLELLQSLNGNITDKQGITDIVIGGGFNDRSRTQEQVLAAIAEFVAYVKSVYPNAKVHIAFIGWSFNAEFVKELKINNVISSYKQCSRAGASYVDHSDEVMHDSRLFLRENQAPYTLLLGYQYVHPNDLGSQAIANCISNYLICGSGVSYDSEIIVTPSLKNGITITLGNIDLLMSKSNNVISIAKQHYNLSILKFSTAVNFNGQPIEIGTLESGFVAGTITGDDVNVYDYIPVNGFALVSDENKSFSGFMLIANNRMYLLAYIDGATSVTDVGIYNIRGDIMTNQA